MTRPQPPDESLRLSALRSFQILDTPRERSFDDLTALAGTVCRTPIAAVSLIDEGRQWLKSVIGLDAAESPREISFCTHAILGSDLFVVPDACQDPRFAHNPAVAGDPQIRFYAGVPLITTDGYALGTLCVADHVPRELSEEQCESLRAIARQVMALLELRRVMSQQQRVQSALLDAQAMLRRVIDGSPGLSIMATDRGGRIVLFSRGAERMFGWSAEEVIGTSTPTLFHDPAELEKRRQAMRAGGREASLFETLIGNPAEGDTEQSWTCVRKDGSRFFAVVSANPLRGGGGELTGYLLVGRDVSEEKEVDLALRRNELWFRSLASSSPVGIYRTDTDGLCEYTNPCWQEIAGLTFHESLGRGWTSVVHPEDRASVLAAWDDAVRRNEEFAMEYRITRGGEVAYVHSRAAPARGPNGELAGWVGTVEDVTAHRRAEEALRTSEERLQRVLEGSNDGFWDWNVVTGEVRFSQRLAEMIGYTLDEMPPHVTTWEQLVHPDDSPQVMAAVRDHLEGKTEFYETEHRLRCKNGQWMWILDRGKVVARSADGTPLRMAGTHTDISERKKAERELDRFFDLSLDLLAIATSDGWFRRLNPAFETILGYSMTELLGSPFYAFIHPDDVASTKREAEKLRAGHHTVRFENRFVCRDGSVKWIAWSATPVSEEGLIYTAGRDITESKNAEKALRESETRTRSIIANSLGAVITTDENGKVVSINPAGERMFGYRADQIMGQTVARLYAEKIDLGAVAQASLGRVTGWAGRRANGEEFPCEVSLFEFQAGDARHFAAHVMDISDRLEAERMKRDFVATVSHELRTPLTSIRGSLGLLASGKLGVLPDEAQALVIVAERNSVRLITLINEILDFEKLDSGSIELDFEALPVARVIERSIEMVSMTAAQEGVAIESDSCAGSVLGDEMRLQQVMVNLLSNAIKYSPRGSRVFIQASLGHGAVEVRVSDCGPGIAEDAQRRLFQRFHQVDASDSRSKSGTGLGLAICRNIVALHGGDIGVESRKGEGSTFWFRVPAIAVSNRKSRPSLLVLVCHHEPATVASVLRAAGEQSCGIVYADDVDDAQRLLKLHRFSLLVVDSEMPRVRELMHVAPDHTSMVVLGGNHAASAAPHADVQHLVEQILDLSAARISP